MMWAGAERRSRLDPPAVPSFRQVETRCFFHLKLSKSGQIRVLLFGCYGPWTRIHRDSSLYPAYVQLYMVHRRGMRDEEIVVFKGVFMHLFSFFIFHNFQPFPLHFHFFPYRQPLIRTTIVFFLIWILSYTVYLYYTILFRWLRG